MQLPNIINIDKHINLLYDYFRKAGVKDEDTMQDLVGATLARLSTSIENYDSTKSAPTTWLYWQMWSVLSNYYRDKSKSEDALDHGTIPIESMINRRDERHDASDKLASMIGRSQVLSDQQRTLMLLRWYEGYKLFEIADRLELTYANARQIHSRAVALLKEEYGTEAEGTAVGAG